MFLRSDADDAGLENLDDDLAGANRPIVKRRVDSQRMKGILNLLIEALRSAHLASVSVR